MSMLTLFIHPNLMGSVGVRSDRALPRDSDGGGDYGAAAGDRAAQASARRGIHGRQVRCLMTWFDDTISWTLSTILTSIFDRPIWFCQCFFLRVSCMSFDLAFLCESRLIYFRLCPLWSVLIISFPDWSEAHEAIAAWLAAGELTADEDVSEGIENTRDAFFALFRGLNTGKKVVKF